MSYRLLLFQIFKHLLVVLVLIGSIGSILGQKANAAGFSVSIDPPITFVQMVENTEVKTPITITNEGGDGLNLSIVLKPFTAKNERGEVLMSEDPLPISPFISILLKDKPVNELLIVPGESLELVLRIAPLPKQEDSYFSILFMAKDAFVPKDLESKLEPQDVAAYSQLKPGIATNVLLSFQENPQDNLSFDFQTQNFFESGPVDFALKITNNNKRARPLEGTIFIRNLFGQTVGKIELPSLYILAESSRIYSALRWDEEFLLGPYSASVVIKPNANGEGGESRPQEIRFYALPYRTAGITTFFILILLITIIRIRKKLHFS